MWLINMEIITCPEFAGQTNRCSGGNCVLNKTTERKLIVLGTAEAGYVLVSRSRIFNLFFFGHSCLTAFDG